MNAHTKHLQRGEQRGPVVVFNVKYSENLGDGLIAEAIEAGLAEHCDREIVTLDVAGRTAYGEESVRNKSFKLAVLDRMPDAVTRGLSKMAVSSIVSKQLSTWRSAISQAEHVVIGGGHLFQDDNLNFPQKIGAVLDLCAQEDVPVSIYAVGVTSGWSPEAQELFGRLVECNVASVSVRDARSQKNWAGHFAGTFLERADVRFDPVLSGMRAPRSSGKRRIGLGIIHPRCIARHSAVNTEEFMNHYSQITAHLLAQGYDVGLFTNGAREDAEALDQIAQQAEFSQSISEGRLVAHNRPETPKALTDILNGFDCVVAHRLHACIGAYTAGIPSVGLGWDAKLESFFRLTGRSDCFLPAGRVNTIDVVDCVGRALGQGLDQSIRDEVARSARQGLEKLGSIVCGARQKDARQDDGRLARPGTQDGNELEDSGKVGFHG